VRKPRKPWKSSEGLRPDRKRRPSEIPLAILLPGMLATQLGCGGDSALVLRESGCEGASKNAEGLILDPFDVPPQLVDPSAAREAIADAKGQVSPNVDGVARVWFTVDVNGEVIDAQIAQSSGASSADSAAVRAARRFRFFPAERLGEPACSSTALPVAINN